MADENITSALVTDSRGKVLVHLLRPRPAEMPQLVFAPERINPPRFDLEAPVTTNGISSRWTAIEAGETVGWLQLRTWLSSTDAVLNLLARQYLLLGGLAAGLVGTLVATGYGEVRRQAKLREQQVNQEKAALEYIALIDPLTGLFNRRGVERALNETLLDSSSRAEAALAICMIDLDDFKPVNDTYGHDVGDQLLTAVGQRLKSYLREGDCVGRIGGDEFIAVFRHCPERAQATALAKRISDGLGMPFQIGSLLLRIGASVGVVIDAEQQIAPDFMPYPADIASSGEKSMASIHLESLMQQADRAMYTVKQNGKSQIAIAPPALKG
ncbi:MAG: GGDEF domain-containing protein [Cyanobium sp.]